MSDTAPPAAQVTTEVSAPPPGPSAPAGERDPGTQAPQPAKPAEQTFSQSDVERIVAERLARERKKFSDYGELKEQASKAKTVEEQLEEMRKKLTERDEVDLKKAGRLARAQVEAKVAESGFSAADVAPLLDRIDPTSLLKDGEPDPKEVASVVASLIKAGGRSTPDRDQGQRGGEGPLDMNALIRRRAGIGT